MGDLADELAQELAALHDAGLHRQLRRVESAQSTPITIGGKVLLNFSSNDYLGLADHPVLKEAAIRGLERYGAGSGASRLICGSLAPHHDLELALSAFKRTEAALAFSSGYATALGTICALVGKDDAIVIDRLVHASLVDAARLSGAKLRVFPHNDLNALARILSRARAGGPRRILIVTESVFSMDGDVAPLRELVELKERHGAWLMLDEAHATGLYGDGGRGLANAAGVNDRIEVQMGTLGKALGAAGGYICGRKELIELLVNRARSFIFSTAPVPAAALAAAAAIGLVQTSAGAERREALWRRVTELQLALGDWTGTSPGLMRRDGSPGSAILPLMVGEEDEAVRLSEALLKRGVFVPAIRYPTVARKQARLRLTVTAAHRAEDVAQFLAAWREIGE